MADGDDANKTWQESAIRKEKYKQLLDIGSNAMEELESKSVVENFGRLIEIVQKSNELASEGKLTDRVGQLTEVVLDAQVLKLATDLMGTTVRKIDNAAFSDESYAAALTQYVTDDNGGKDWAKLDAKINEFTKVFRYGTSMFGSVDFEEKEATQATQKQRQARRKADVGVEKRPNEVEEIGNEEQGMARVNSVYEQLLKLYDNNNKMPIPYYKLIIDPTNMMHTFDNSFQISFLFRDGFVKFGQDHEGMPVITPLTKQEQAEVRPTENTSFCVTLNHKIIQGMVQKYNIRQAMLKRKK